MFLKKIRIFAILVLCLSFAVQASAAGLLSGEALPQSAEPAESAPLALPKVEQGEVAVSFGVTEDHITVGETLQITVTVAYPADLPLPCRAQWSIDGTPQAALTNDRFVLRNGKTSVFTRHIGEDYRGIKDITVGFSLFINGVEMAATQKTVTIIDPILEAKKADERAYITSLVQPVRVEATVARNATLYRDVMLKTAIGSVSSGTKCQVIASKTDYSNQVRLSDGRTGWLSYRDLWISTKNYTKTTDISNGDKDLFVRTMGYTSETDYLIWVHLECQKVNVFMKKNGVWCIEKVFPCASGKNATPTVTGVFKYYALQNRWPYDTYYVGPVMIFSGNYALHSVLMRYDGSVYDGTVGRPASHGCVRLRQDDMLWLRNFIPLHTTVVVY